MHNCLSIRSRLVELALDELSLPAARKIRLELNDCTACQSEFAAIQSTLRVSTTALQSSVPEPEFWISYEEKLRRRLEQSVATNPRNAGSTLGWIWTELTRITAASIRVPVPAAIALIALLGVSAFALRSSPTAPPISEVNPIKEIETKTVQV